MRTQDDMSLQTMVDMGKVCAVVLPDGSASRWLRATAAARPDLESRGYRLVLVHGKEEPDFAAHELQYVARIADPERVLSQHFELGEARRFRVVGAPQPLPAVVWFDGAESVRVDAAVSFGDTPSFRD